MIRETKVYLNTVKDLTKALKDGNTIYATNELRDGESKIELKNNILIIKNQDGSILINATIYFKANVFYLKEKPALKIEVGKFYKTRNGSKVICIGSQPYEDDDSEYKMFFGIIGDTQTFWTRGNRRFYKYGREDGYDIVDYWED